jgi:hypothetical protein
VVTTVHSAPVMAMPGFILIGKIEGGPSSNTGGEHAGQSKPSPPPGSQVGSGL